MMQVIGDVALQRKFDSMSVKVQKKISRQVIMKAGRRTAKAAKPKVTIRSGTLKKSIGTRGRTYKDDVMAVVGPRQGFRTTVDGEPHDPAKIGHLVERGHGGPGPARAYPFLRPALDETNSSNKSLIAAELGKKIEAEARKR